MAVRDMASLGDLVREYRRALGLTQDALAERAGLSERAVREIERGSKHTPRPDTVRLLADALELAGAQRAAFEVTAGRAGRSDTLLYLNTPNLDGERYPTNLPDEATPFIGREREIAQIVTLFDQPTVRLVTLTGTGGTGKTRLALQVAAALLPAFSDGVFLVSLASLADAALVPSAMAEVLGVKEKTGKNVLDSLIAWLQPKQLLLVLDNCEHLLDAAPVISSLLNDCRDLRVLVTSRIPLHLSREREHFVPPLSVPDPLHLPTLEDLLQYESVALFVERATAVKDTFAITDDNAAAVAGICSRLDGLPLAIELAAARIKLFPPEALLPRLSDSLNLLTGGANDRPARQQTLRGAIDWSYSLLAAEERKLFARLSVFAGGCTFEAAEAVWNPDRDLELLDGLGNLVEKCLLQQGGRADPRFGMLETVRAYAAERLRETAEREVARRQHALYYLSFVEKVAPALYGPRQAEWLARLENEHDNVRAALQWASESGEAEIGLQLAGALRQFWLLRGYRSEGRRWLETHLAVGRSLAQGVSDAVRAKALQALGVLSDEPGRSVALLEESLALYRVLGDQAGTGDALVSLASALHRQGDEDRVTRLVEESLSLGQMLDDKRVIAISLDLLGDIAYTENDLAQRQVYFEESLRLNLETGNKAGIVASLRCLGFTSLGRGEYERAETFFEECLDLARELGDRRSVILACQGLGHVARERGNYERARAFYEEGLTVSEPMDDVSSSAVALLALSDLARDLGEAERVTELCTQSLALFRSLEDKMNMGYSLHNLGLAQLQRGDYERAEALCREGLEVVREARIEPASVEVLTSMGMIANARGSYEQAKSVFMEVLHTMQTNGFGVGRVGAVALEGMAQVASAHRQFERAACLLGAAGRLRTAIGAPIYPVHYAGYEQQIARVKTALGDTAWSAAWERGEALSEEQSILYALEEFVFSYES